MRRCVMVALLTLTLGTVVTAQGPVEWAMNATIIEEGASA